TCHARLMQPWASCKTPRLPMKVPRSGMATISPDGVTRFCLGMAGLPRLLPGASDAVQALHRPLVAHVAGVQRRGWLGEKKVGFLLGNGPVFDATRHDQEFALFEPDVPILELHAEAALDDQEEFVLVVVVVPDERPLELDQLHLLAVQFTHDLRLPLLAEQR